MDEPTKKLVASVNEKTFTEIMSLARTLHTTPGGVISQALAILRLAQGRKIIFQQEHSNVKLVTRTYEDKQTRPTP